VILYAAAYYDDDYRKDFYARYHIGKTVHEDSAEYLRRSPVTYANKLKTPLLIHTNTIDDDVHVEEVKHLIEELKAAGKKFDFKFSRKPWRHSFDRIDTKLAKQTRLKIYNFLAQYWIHP